MECGYGTIGSSRNIILSIRDRLRDELLAAAGRHHALVAAIRSVSQQPPTYHEVSGLTKQLEVVLPDSKNISAAADQIYSGSLRSAAIAIHLTHQCALGIENDFSFHWQGLQPDVRVGITKALTDRLLVLRERAVAIHNVSEADITRAIDELIEKLDALPLSIRTKLIDAILADAITVSLVTLINKLYMLTAEMPDQVEVELRGAMKVGQ